MNRAAPITALERARLMGPSVEGLLDLALAYHLAGDVGAEVSAAARRDAARSRLARGLVAATRTGSRVLTVSASASRPAAERSRSARTRRSAELLARAEAAAAARRSSDRTAA